MRLNETLAELNDNNFEEYGEGKYYLTVMGTPSATEPWGWQLDGHHLIINYFVLGDQVVMTPSFWGSEPAVATPGKYAGTRIMADEQHAGLAMVRSLTAQQRERAVLEPKKTGNNIRAQLFSDNVVVDYAGVPVASFTASQKQQLARSRRAVRRQLARRACARASSPTSRRGSTRRISRGSARRTTTPCSTTASRVPSC